MELEEEYFSSFGFEVSNTMANPSYRVGTTIPKKPTNYDTHRKKKLRKHIKMLNPKVRRLTKRVSNLKELFHIATTMLPKIQKLPFF